MSHFYDRRVENNQTRVMRAANANIVFPVFHSFLLRTELPFDAGEKRDNDLTHEIDSLTRASSIGVAVKERWGISVVDKSLQQEVDKLIDGVLSGHVNRRELL